jgi:glycosyltransferase involved in cell wall biosynthesis
MAAGERLRIAILWERMSGYTHAEFAALAARGVDVRVMHRAVDGSAPFDQAAVTAGLRATAWEGEPDARAVEALLDEHDPHAVLVCSWVRDAYRRAARRRKGRTLRVLCMDNQWWATPKQRLGSVTAPLLIRPAFDAAFVPGERSADFARRLGFPDERIIRGMNCCDYDSFARVAEARGDALPPPVFTYVGRLVAYKAIDVLVEGYRRYQALVPDPWPLRVAGTGPEAALLAGVPGVEQLGFVQAADLPALLAASGCLVLPSRFEPWAVVVHEAAAAGLPVVCTWVCGAAAHLVVDGYNGVIISPDDPDALAQGLARITRTPDEARRAMGAASRSLAAQLTPERWADQVVGRVSEIRELLGLAVPPGASAAAAPPGPPRSAPV